jgi:cAMP-dependent protein kinase regulator
MSDAAFAEEVMSLLENVFPSAQFEPGELLALAAPEASGPSRPIVASPLFKDFSVDEMVAVIQGLKLITCEPGEIIITQGDPGDSLYILTSGAVKAFVRDAEGRQTQVGVFGEGAFFGEISILTGKPRAATIVAASRCELLELDRRTLDSITKAHPHVWHVLEEFAQRRTAPRK